jgi:hypothetical protein
MMNILPNEIVVPNDYPIYLGYWYLVDGKPKRSHIAGTAWQLKEVLEAKEIRICDAVERNLPLI